jgi:NAD(P)-dependent dehydrogenase (short-subunit alcohol dehydrogenase family)
MALLIAALIARDERTSTTPSKSTRLRASTKLRRSAPHRRFSAARGPPGARAMAQCRFGADARDSMELRLDDRVALVTGRSLGLRRHRGGYCGRRPRAIWRVAKPPSLRPANRTPPVPRSELCLRRDRCVAIPSTCGSWDLGPVDIPVNNAGKAEARPFEDVSDAIWQADLDLKLFAAIRLTRLVWPHMKAQRFGRIINLLNTHAKTPAANTAPTSVTRAAGMALSKVLAGEGAPHNILVNALLIGRIVSDQIRRGHAASDGSLSLEEFIARAGARLPMGRMGEARECASVALFLASDAASYLTGCAINMDGGLSPVV